MAVTRRGKVAVRSPARWPVTGVGVGALALTGHAPAALQRAIDSAAAEAETPPPVCPLTGAAAPGGKIPQPTRARREDREPARGTPPGRARPRRHRLRGAGRGRHHPVHRAVPVQRRREGRTRPQRSHDRPARSSCSTGSRRSRTRAVPTRCARRSTARGSRTSPRRGAAGVHRDPHRVAPHNLFSTTATCGAAAKLRTARPDAVVHVQRRSSR